MKFFDKYSLGMGKLRIFSFPFVDVEFRLLFKIASEKFGFTNEK
jgi:hypothetical protein